MSFTHDLDQYLHQKRLGLIQVVMQICAENKIRDISWVQGRPVIDSGFGGEFGEVGFIIYPPPYLSKINHYFENKALIDNMMNMLWPETSFYSVQIRDNGDLVLSDQDDNSDQVIIPYDVSRLLADDISIDLQDLSQKIETDILRMGRFVLSQYEAEHIKGFLGPCPQTKEDEQFYSLKILIEGEYKPLDEELYVTPKNLSYEKSVFELKRSRVKKLIREIYLYKKAMDLLDPNCKNTLTIYKDHLCWS